MERHGMLHLYIGNGKGKTTAAVGLALRAMGSGFNVLFAQFLKSADTGEKRILEQFPDKLCYFRPKQRHSTFLWNMTQKQLDETKEDISTGWCFLKQEILSPRWNLIVMDEILDTIQCRLLPEEDVIQAIENRPQDVEIVCTGRNASSNFREKADYISWVEALKHPYEKGIKGRRGIEF